MLLVHADARLMVSGPARRLLSCSPVTRHSPSPVRRRCALRARAAKEGQLSTYGEEVHALLAQSRLI